MMCRATYPSTMYKNIRKASHIISICDHSLRVLMSMVWPQYPFVKQPSQFIYSMCHPPDQLHWPR